MQIGSIVRTSFVIRIRNIIHSIRRTPFSKLLAPVGFALTEHSQPPSIKLLLAYTTNIYVCLCDIFALCGSQKFVPDLFSKCFLVQLMKVYKIEVKSFI